MTTLTISLPDSLRDFIQHEVDTKGYGNVSEYVRGLVRDAQKQEMDSRLEALLLDGLTPGNDLALTADFWNQLRAEAKRILGRKTRTRRRRAAK